VSWKDVLCVTVSAAICGGTMIESVVQRSAFRRMGNGLIASARNVLRYARRSLLHTVKGLSS
jgi:hypothetical protein